MANPTLRTLSDGEAEALQGTTDSKTGSPLIAHDHGPLDTPPLKTLLTQLQDMYNRLVGPAAQGQVVEIAASGLNVGVFGMQYEIGGTPYSYAGQTTVAMTDDATNYLYLDGSATVQKSTSAFPANIIKLAVVVAASGAVSSITDARPRNYQVAVANAWSTLAATQDVDMAGNGLDDLAHMELTDPTELTISAGSITPTQGWHTVDTEADTSSDNLDTITATAGEVGRLLLIYPEDSGRNIVVRDAAVAAGNIYIMNANSFVNITIPVPSYMLLIQDTASTWREIARGDRGVGPMTASLAMNDNAIEAVSMIGFDTTPEVTIASGSFTYGKSLQAVETEAMASTDDLDTVVGGTQGQILILYPYSGARTVVVKHGVGVSKFKLANDLDFAMTSEVHALECRHDGTQWVEISRSPMDVADLAGTSRAIPYSPGCFFIEGALSAGVFEQEIYCPVGFTIVNVTGVVPTAGAPSGGACIVDVQDDAASIFANEGEMINIADGETWDTSATKDHSVAAGSKLRLEVKSTGASPNGADNLTVVINGRIAAVTPP